MIWTGQICVSVNDELDTAISDKAVEISGVDEQRQILYDAIHFWLTCFPAAVVVSDIPQTDDGGWSNYRVFNYEKFEQAFLAPKQVCPPKCNRREIQFGHATGRSCTMALGHDEKVGHRFR